MELHQLRYFLELSRELHFQKAAEKAHVTQPTLSQQIKKLEDELGFVPVEEELGHGITQGFNQRFPVDGLFNISENIRIVDAVNDFNQVLFFTKGQPDNMGELFSNHLQQGQAVHIVNHEIADNDVDILAGQDFQRIPGIIDKGFLKSFFLQQEFNLAQYGFMVINK